MVAFFFCGIIGFAQIFILNEILKGVLKSDFKKVALTILLKFAVYAVGFTILYFFLLQFKYQCGAGFMVGVISAVVIIFIKSKKQGAFRFPKGDDVDEHSRTN